MNQYQKMVFNAETLARAEMKDVSSPGRANGVSGLRTVGMALVELMMLFAAIKAKDFQERPTVRNLTDWCNAAELVDDSHTAQARKYRQIRHTIRRKIVA